MLFALVLSAIFTVATPETRPSNSPPPSTIITNEPPQAKPNDQRNEPGHNQQGTERDPLIVKVVPTPKSQAETAQDAEDREQKAASDWWTVRLTGALVIVGTVQGWVFYIQARRLKQTIGTMQAISRDQSSDVNKSIEQATRAATAMEGVSNAMTQNVAYMSQMMEMQKEFWQKEMRCYISVVVGSAVYQDRGRNLRFEAKPLVLNNGHTPAHNFSYKIKADVLPDPLNNTYDFNLLSQDVTDGAVIGPHQNRIMNAIVDHTYCDHEVEDIKAGRGKALCVWGIVYYTDVFGLRHFTNFCQVINWVSDNQIIGYYHRTHNDSD